MGYLRHDGKVSGLPKRNFSAWSGAADYFAQDRPEFKKNVINYYGFIRENDVTLTHALVNLQRSRSPSPADVLSDQVALTVMDENDAGIVVRGSRLLATLGPISDEIAIYPVASHRLDGDASRQSFSFSIPCDTAGLKFLCRESLDLGRSHFNHPLGSRFEEMDATVFFDDVLVPWERVFLLGDVDLCNNYAAGTHSNSHTGHQVLTRCAVKAEFILGKPAVRRWTGTQLILTPAFAKPATPSTGNLHAAMPSSAITTAPIDGAIARELGISRT